MNENKFIAEGLAAGLKTEQAKQLTDAFRRVSVAAKQAAQAFQLFSAHNTELINLCPNKRLVYLALHHPKERVRKKNKNRIYKKEL